MTSPCCWYNYCIAVIRLAVCDEFKGESREEGSDANIGMGTNPVIFPQIKQSFFGDSLK
jgi:hypothetical protein